MKGLALIPCLMATLLAGCATGPKHGGQPTPPHVRLQRYGTCYLKPVYVNPPYGRDRNNVAAVQKINQELADHLKWVFPSLVPIKDDGACAPSSTPSVIVEPVIEKMKFVRKRATWSGTFKGSSYVRMQVGFRDPSSGKTIARPTFYRVAGGGKGLFSGGATDNVMLSRVVWDVFDYVTQGTVPSDSIPPEMDAGSADPSEEELARIAPAVPVTAGGSVTVKDANSPAPGSAPGKPVSQAELADIAINERDLQTRNNAVEQMTDQKFIGKVACEARDSGVRLAAVQRLSDQALLGNIALRERHWKVRLAAVERVAALDVLETVAARDAVVAVQDAARARLALLKR
jgi:hypothetical protein